MTLPLSPSLAGRLLQVDLTHGRVETLDTRPYARRFLGGRGLATALYFDLAPATGRFDDEANPLLITVGPLCGAPGGLGGSRWGIFGRSPLPAAEHAGRHHFCYGNLGGRFGAELRFAGYDGLVITGRAERPVFLAIEDDRAELRAARDLWGRTTTDTMTRLRDRTAPRSRFLAIGPAGERGVPLATVFADGDASCSGGMGAALGAKGLKAVAVRGSHRRVEVADRETLRHLDHRIRGFGRGNVRVWGLDFMAHGPQTKKAPCFGCMGHCLRVRYRAADGSRGKFMCQSRFFYMHHAFGFYGEENDVPFHANRLCDEQGVDTWEIQALLDWLLACREAGALSATDTGLDLSRVGSLEFIRDLVHGVAHREGFGAVLADGARAASQRVGGAAERAYVRTDPYDPRYCTVNLLLHPFETREPIQQLHEAGLVLSQWSSWAKGVPEAHLDSEVVRGIAERFWGSTAAGDMTTLEGKAEAAKRIQERQLAKESLGVCDWMFPLIDNPTGPDHVGDPTLESQILSAVIGAPVSAEDLQRLGERVFHVQRAILLREGHRPRLDDVLPREWHEQAIETHVADPDLLAPGPGGAIVSLVGQRATWPEFERLRDQYYELRGWDVPTGLPSREGLQTLGLDDVADALAARGLLAPRARTTPLPTRLRHEAHRARGRLTDALSRVSRWLPRHREAPAESLRGDALHALLETERGKFGLPSIRHNFAEWNKTMQYRFPDIDEVWILRFVDGEAQPPERLAVPLPAPDISYEMSTGTLRAMSAGELSGDQAYFRRKLRIRASFADMLKLQSLNKV